ncbi:MAG TPA: CpsD/CapB family tyrosine-protein kinase [Candidatus Eubacterium faecipullorum]|uniref:non-specific protein-tyrosine kinase n=1 Tax=Candidatus Eubacterium faecipullorum TaxID=2838571 RepID=A0A9D1UHA1_9FIRM|nr:CpsD/CapB family tyrosine-protein kinase [Candidatus Eubacterium faecipullorum]
MNIFKKNKNASQKTKAFSREDPKKILNQESPFVVKEAYSAIRTNLLFMQKGEKCPVFVVTSPTANNGKTINSINLAISFAQMGKKTLIIDGDMRNPTIHRMFSIPVKNGLSEILAGLTDNSITVSKTGIENLSVLTGGKIPPNPAELISSSRMDKLLEFVKEHYDCVFIDTPPVNLVTDATVFAQKTTGYILIVKADTTDIADVKASVSNLNNIGGNILGFILNDVTTGRGHYYSYYKKYDYKYKYSYGYGYGYGYK